MLPEWVISLHLSVCHLPPAPCAPRRQRACQPRSLCVPSVQPGAQHGMGISGRVIRGSGLSVHLTIPVGPQAYVGGDPAQPPGASSRSRHDSMFPDVEPVA